MCLAALPLSPPALTSLNTSAEPDTQVVHIYMELWSRTVLNTFDGTLTMDHGTDKSVTVPFSLTAAEIDTILKVAREFDFFALPDTIPDAYGVSRGSDLNPDVLRIKWGEQDHMVVWYYPFRTEDRRRGFLPLRLANFIWELAVSKVNPDFRVPYSGEDKRIGYLAKFHYMHAIPPARRIGDPLPTYAIFDVYEEGRTVDQIVVVYQPGLEPPPYDTDKLIMLVGEISRGRRESDAEGEYSSECMYVREWHYLPDDP